MKYWIPLVWACLWAPASWAQPAPDPVVERFASTITARDLRAHMYFLADDLLEGRETGERGMHLAAHYIRTQFRRLGLPGAVGPDEYYQTYYVNWSEVSESSLKIGKKSYGYGEGYFHLQQRLPASFPAELAFAGFGLQTEGYNNLQHTRLAGKTAVVMAGDPAGSKAPSNRFAQLFSWISRSESVEAAGAAAMLLLLPDTVYNAVRRFASSRSSSISGEEEQEFPVLIVSESLGKQLLEAAGQDWAQLAGQLKTSDAVPALDFKKAKFSFSCVSDGGSKPAMNVLGYLEGTDKADEVLVITGHYDHIGITNGEINNGADDDASGTSTVLELAEAFTEAARAGYRPRRSILFMTVSGEEKGLWGSEFYANHPVYPIANTVANLNIDMIGRIDPRYEKLADSTNYVYIIGSDKLSTQLHEANEAANQAYTNLVLDYTYNDDKDPNRFYYRSDHYNFAEKGIPIIFYFTGTHVDYHRPTDDPHKIRYEKTAKIARLVFATAWDLANRESRPVVDKPVKP
ncbi:MAG: M28 family peptidase [Bacteroidia bacterium]|nr:M28 family peptidase [Bacteroidia bacterium]